MIKRLNERIQKDQESKAELEAATITESKSFTCLLCNETLPNQVVLAKHLESFVTLLLTLVGTQEAFKELLCGQDKEADKEKI